MRHIQSKRPTIHLCQCLWHQLIRSNHLSRIENRNYLTSHYTMGGLMYNVWRNYLHHTPHALGRQARRCTYMVRRPDEVTSRSCVFTRNDVENNISKQIHLKHCERMNTRSSYHYFLDLSPSSPVIYLQIEYLWNMYCRLPSMFFPVGYDVGRMPAYLCLNSFSTMSIVSL